MATAKKAAPAAKAAPAKKAAAKYDGFSDDERDAMKEHAKELKAAATRGAKADTEGEVLAKIAEMEPEDRALAEKLHKIVKANAPELVAKTWYGMPAYATPGKDGKIVCFFQPAKKFKTRYSTLGFNDAAKLDDGAIWPTAYALTKLSAADEKKIGTLIKKAAS